MRQMPIGRDSHPEFRYLLAVTAPTTMNCSPLICGLNASSASVLTIPFPMLPRGIAVGGISPTSSSDGIGSASAGSTASSEPRWRIAYPLPPREVTGYLVARTIWVAPRLVRTVKPSRFLLASTKPMTRSLAVEPDRVDAAGRPGDDVGLGDREDQHPRRPGGQADVF